MKTILTALFAFAMLAIPATAQTISNVDHPDIPNCTVRGPNVANCENLTIQAIYAHNGTGTKSCYTDPATHEKSCSYSW